MSCCLWMGAHVLLLMTATALAKAIRWRKGPQPSKAQAWRLSNEEVDHMAHVTHSAQNTRRNHNTHHTRP